MSIFFLNSGPSTWILLLASVLQTTTRIKTHGSVPCSPRKRVRESILTGTTKLQFSHIHSSVIFYPIANLLWRFPPTKGDYMRNLKKIVQAVHKI